MRSLCLSLVLFLLVGCGKTTPPPPNPPPVLPPWRVLVHPFALEKTALLDEAIQFAELHTKARFVRVQPVEILWDKILVGGKANSAALVQLMVGEAKKLKPADRVLAVVGVTERDIGSGGDEAVSFARSREDRAGVLSWYRVSNEALGLPSDDALLARRAGKQLVILAGRLLGFPKCGASSCIHADPKDLSGLDAMGGDPCPSCCQAWSAALSK